MYKQVLTPDSANHTIEMPEEFYSKTVEVIITEVTGKRKHAEPPAGKKVSITDLLEGFGEAPDFPSAEELRKEVWPSKW